MDDRKPLISKARAGFFVFMAGDFSGVVGIMGRRHHEMVQRQCMGLIMHFGDIAGFSWNHSNTNQPCIPINAPFNVI